MNDLSTNHWLEIHPKLGMSLMDYLFERLDGIYAGKWKAGFKSPSEINNWRIVWSSGFDHHKITLQEIKSGLENLPILYPDWTPTLGQFIAACRHKEVKHVYHEKFPALPKYKTQEDKIKGLEQLGKIKEMLSKSRLLNKEHIDG